MRTLSANLTAAMDLRLFTPYIRIHIDDISGAGNMLYSVQPIKYRLGATEASFTCVPPSTSLANLKRFYFERGAVINGTPDTIESSIFATHTISYDGKFLHVTGGILKNDIGTGTVSGTYNANIDNVFSDGAATVDTINYEGTPAWKNYNFLPSVRTLNNPEYFLSLIRQKYLLFIREEGHTLVGGLQEHFNQISVFCATDSRAQDYTITDQLFKFQGGTSTRYFLWRDEANTIHTDISPGPPMHNLGYLESTDNPPTNTASPKPGSMAIVPIHLKYQRGDYVTINSGAAGDIHEYTGRIDVVEVLDIDKEPAWYNEIVPLVHFTNTEGGALPSTIERVAAYTPLVTTDFNNVLDATVNNLQAFADAVDDHDHSGLATTEGIQDIIGAMVSSNTETGIAVTYDDTNGKLNFDAQTAGDTRYAPIAKGVTNGDSHNHVGGDGAALTYTQTLPMHGLNGTPAAGSTNYLPPYYYGVNAIIYNFLSSKAGTLKNLKIVTNSAQPATGTLVFTVMVENAASAITTTVTAGAAAATWSDTTHSVSINSGDRVSLRVVNNATGASAQIGGASLELEINTA